MTRKGPHKKTNICIVCSEKHNISATDTQSHEYHLRHELIQDIFPKLNAASRELLITNICDTCFDARFNSADKETND